MLDPPGGWLAALAAKQPRGRSLQKAKRVQFVGYWEVNFWSAHSPLVAASL